MRRAIIYLVAIIAVSCVGQNHHVVNTQRLHHEFKFPEIPSIITNDGERMIYFTEHYWDNYDFADSLLIANDSVSGTAIANYIQLLQINVSVAIRRSVDRMLNRALSVHYDNFIDFTLLLEEYLYAPNSPMRSEELYIPILRYIISSERIDDVDKLRAAEQLKMALKNRPGDLSVDFDYTLKSGLTQSMHDLKANYTILFFNSPDCEDCVRVKGYISRSKIFEEMIDGGELKILAIYPESDLELWRSGDYPPSMINSYDQEQQITLRGLYDLRAIPTIYLLDRDKRVLLKDTVIEQVEIMLRADS